MASVSPDSKARITALFELYAASMQAGRRMEELAVKSRQAADEGSDDYKRMKGENRERRGHSLNPTTGQANDDARFSQFTIAQDALKTNAWEIQRAQMYATEAAMHFGKAAAIMADIQYELISVPFRRR